MSPNSSKKRDAAAKSLPVSRWIYYGCIGLFLIIASFLRIWYLDRFPTGIVMDEFDYVLNAKYIYHTGTNIYNNWSPWSLTTFPREVPKGELTYLVSLPFVGPFGLSLLTARIGFALISVVFVLALFGIATTLFGTTAGLVTGFIAAINPWSIYFGRTAFDVPVSITFFLLSFLCLLRLRGKYLLLTVIPLFFAFYNYIGTKLLFVPFVFVSVVGIWYIVRKKQDTRWYVAILLLSLIIFGHFMFRMQSTTASLRVNQIFTPFYKDIIRDVNDQRRQTLASPFISLFANKAVVYTNALITKFLGAFSPSLLFTNGEGLSTLSLWQHGLFYPIDAVFLVFGLVSLYTAAPQLFFLAIIGLSTIPSVFSTVGTSYVHRSGLMYPYMMILIGYGITMGIKLIRDTYKTAAMVIVALLYVAATINFTHLYFYRFPYYNSESFGLSQRLYSRYASLAEKNSIPVINLTDSPELYFKNYLFYTNALNAKTIPETRKIFETQSYVWHNAQFTKTCPSKADIQEGSTAYILSLTSPCKELFINQPMTVIPSLSDGGTLYMIFNDKTCCQYALSAYPTGFSASDFLVEHLSEKQFCERFVIRYANPLYLPQDTHGGWISQ